MTFNNQLEKSIACNFFLNTLYSKIILITSVILLSACGGGNSSDEFSFVSNAVVAIDEEQMDVITVKTRNASSNVTYSIDSSLDGIHFTIDKTTGKLEFFSIAPDFEHPKDSDTDNIYEVEVSAFDTEQMISQVFYIVIVNTSGGLISDLNFSDVNLTNCVNDFAQSLGVTSVDEYSFLDCTEGNITDLDGIENLTSLKYLSLSANNISTLSVLSGLPKLQSIELDSNASPLSIETLSSLPDLTQLSLVNTVVNDLTTLSSLGLLDSLAAPENLSNISQIANLTDITRLSLSSTAITDFGGLTNFTNLNELYLSNTVFSDVSTLSSLNNLFTLDLRNTQVSDISLLAGLSELQFIDLGENTAGGGLTNLDTLSTLINLQGVELDGNISISCNILDTLISTIGSPPINTDSDVSSADIATDGVNCTAP